MPDLTIEDFKDHALFAHAQSMLEAAADHRKRSADAADAAAQKLKTALENSRAAIRGRSTLSAFDAELAVEAADREHRVSEKVSQAAERNYVTVEDLAGKLRGAAFGSAYLAGVRGRISAAAKIDQARLLLIEAIGDFKAAVQLCDQAAGAGHLQYPAHHHQHILPLDQSIELWLSPTWGHANIEAGERARWAGNHVDPNSETTPFAKEMIRQGKEI